MLVQNLAILVLAGFVGFAVISKVPNTLHTPLMSGTNALRRRQVLGVGDHRGAEGALVLAAFTSGNRAGGVPVFVACR
jgi:H+-translocating NAD(P) transhydrogenase subunit alpha